MRRGKHPSVLPPILSQVREQVQESDDVMMNDDDEGASPRGSEGAKA